MKIIKLLFVIQVFSFVTVMGQNVKHVGAGDFNNLVESENGIILDVRTPQEFSRGHINGSTLINIADRKFVSKIKLLQKDKPIYIYCLTGSRSRSAANYMVSQGFSQVYNLQRGILDWQRSGLPVVRGNAAIASNSKSFSKTDFDNLIGSNNLVLVDFHAPWCAPCKKMAPVMDKLSQSFGGKIKIEKIDVEVNREIAETNKIQSIPGFILFKNGKQAWTHKGVIEYNDLYNILNSYL